MNPQTRFMSLVESVTNIAVGYWLAVVTQLLLFPLFNVEVSLRDNMLMGLVFTLVSIVRSYSLRRGFEKLRTRRGLWQRKSYGRRQKAPN